MEIHTLEIGSAGWRELVTYPPCGSEISERAHFIFASNALQIRQQLHGETVLHYCPPNDAISIDAMQPCAISVRAIAPRVEVQHAQYAVGVGCSAFTIDDQTVDAERFRRVCCWRIFFEQELPKHPVMKRRLLPRMTDAEKLTAVQMRETGLTIEQVATAMDRSWETIRRALRNAENSA